ncbi:glycosyltransferase [Patescibacteria group bacterium]
MRILFLNHNQERFGTYWRCLFLGKYLSALGHEIVMICASGENFDPWIRKQKVTDNFTIITLPRFKYHQYLTGQLWRMVISIFQALFYRYDIFHAFTVAQPQIGVPAWVAKKIRRKAMIVDWDDLWGGGFADAHRNIIKKVLTNFERKIPQYADRITYVSSYIGKEIDKLGLGKIATLVPNGSNIDEIEVLDKNKCRRKLKLDPKKKYLLSMGNTYFESFRILLKAVTKVIKEDPSVKLIMLGQVEIGDHVKDLYEPIKDHIILAGSRPFKEVPFYMGAADVLVLPMDDDPIEYARFPIRFGDYLCAGRPIISNAVGEVKKYIDKFDCGLATPYDDVKGLAGNITKVLKDSGLAEELGRKARYVAENELQWKKIAKDMNNVYRSLYRKPGEKLNIVILSPFASPNVGGVETHIDDLARYYQKHGHYTHIITYTPLTTPVKAPHYEKKKNLEIHRMPWVGWGLFNRFEKYPIIQFVYLTPVLFFYTWYLLFVKGIKFDVIHAHGFTAGWITNVLNRYTKPLRPIVCSMHAIYSFEKRKSLARMCRWILWPFDHIFCLAQRSVEDLKAAGLPEEKLSPYVQWVDQENTFKPRDQAVSRKKLGLPTDKFIVLFVGRLINKKGVSVMMKAAEKVPDDVQFIFVGDGPMKSALDEFVKQHKNVHPVGRKSQEETGQYFGACDVFAQPAQYEEGFSRVVIETLSSGRPIIASNKGCLKEMISPEVGVLLDPTPENIAKEINRFYKNIDELRKLESNCRDYALEKFSDKNCEHILHYYYRH